MFLHDTMSGHKFSQVIKSLIINKTNQLISFHRNNDVGSKLKKFQRMRNIIKINNRRRHKVAEMRF
jgi:hypothetical protein